MDKQITELALLLSNAMEERDQYNKRRIAAMEQVAKYRKERDELQEQLRELEATLELHYKACDRARKMYMEAHKCDYWPDMAKNVAWLMEKVHEYRFGGDGESCCCPREKDGRPCLRGRKAPCADLQPEDEVPPTGG